MTGAESAAAELLEACLRRGWTLATCESLTGGGVGAIITAVPGSSRVYRGGLVTYATDLKITLADVDAQFVAAHGVINARTAQEMAVGARTACRTDVALSTTGVAGPDGEGGVDPGVVWVGVCWPGTDGRLQVDSKLLDLPGDRAQVRAGAVVGVLEFALKRLTRH